MSNFMHELIKEKTGMSPDNRPWDHRVFWPTPRANDAEKRGQIANDPRNGLPAAVLYPTPAARDWKDSNCKAEQERHTPPLAVHAGGMLNPTWVEWLMGWPIGWTELEPLEMDRFQQWLEQHGGY